MLKDVRPYIICHMTTSINGKITEEYLNKALDSVAEYYKIHQEFKADAFLCGRLTMASSFTQGYYPDLIKYKGKKIDRMDFVGEIHDFYAIAIDFYGRLGWKQNHIVDDDPGYDNAYIIEVVSENVSDEFLSYLREQRISYIFGGKDKLDLKLVVKKLKELFDIHLLLLEGGRIINGSFLDENLIDELSLVVAPFIESSDDAKDLFRDYNVLQQYALINVKKYDDGTLWLKYKTCDDE